MPHNERRAKQRFPSQLPIFITDNLAAREIQGQTRDVSSEGVFFYVKTWPLEQTRIEIRMALPLGILPAKNVFISCKGWVLRVESEAQRTGIAATLESVTFVNAASP